MNAAWYWRRLRRMSAGEVVARSAGAARQWWWSNPARRPDLLRTVLRGPHHPRVAIRPQPWVPGKAAEAVVLAAEGLLRGEWRLFHLAIPDLPAEPDWFRDPLTGAQAPQGEYCFRVPYRDEAAVGNIKFVWELSRHQPATLLACAWWLTGDDRFAERAAQHLQSWWGANPFLQGVHWISGIEVGLRLLSWTWTRALLAGWHGAPALFEQNETFQRQLYGHSLYLSMFMSVGSSSNNHRIAELAGQLAASVAFPWFRESARWTQSARDGLAREARAQTHADGWNREQASGYHVFVAEMLLAAVLPARMAARPMPDVEDVLRRMLDALAASLDSTGQPPRFGDCDDARGVLVEAPQTDAVAALLDAGGALFGTASWWPASSGSVLGRIAASIAGPAPARRQAVRPCHFPDAGIAILRSGETWLRCDGGPHGYRSIAAHGHADALSLELRHGGTEILVDPGTFCYHGEAEWRAYFRGTRGHSTLTVGSADQASPGGPFLWLTHPRTTLAHWEPNRSWQASHDGYGAAVHHRRVTLDGAEITICDWIDAPGPLCVQLGFHLGPCVEARLLPRGAELNWSGGSALVTLPGLLAWSSHRGEIDPPFGWYSRGFGHREPTTVLAGHGLLHPGITLETRFTLTKADPHDRTPHPDRRGELAGSVRPPGLAGGDDAGPAWRPRERHLPKGEGVHTLP